MSDTEDGDQDAPTSIVRALYDYTAISDSESELSFRAGEEWFFVAALEGGWICVENIITGKMSHVPEGYVTVLPIDASSSASAITATASGSTSTSISITATPTASSSFNDTSSSTITPTVSSTTTATSLLVCFILS